MHYYWSCQGGILILTLISCLSCVYFNELVHDWWHVCFLYVYECAFLERWVYVLCCVPCFQECFLTYSQLSISRSCGNYFLQVQITRSATLFALRVGWTCKKVPNAKLWLEKAIKCFVFIQIDASIFVEFELSEFEISRVDYI